MKCHSSLRFPALAIATLTGCATEAAVGLEQAPETSQTLAASDGDGAAERELQKALEAEGPCSTCCPAPPSATTATATGESTLRVTWSDNSALESGFIVQRSDNDGPWHEIARTVADKEFAIDSLYAGVISFGYRVLAFNELCTSAPSPVAIVPKAPSNLVGVVVSGSRYHLTWRDNSSNETAFVVQHKEGTAPWGDHRTIGANHPFADVFLSPGANRYRVRAITTTGSSWYTNEVSQTF